MTRDEVIRIAGEVGAYRYANRYLKYEPTHTFTVEKLEAFAALVAAEYKKDAERYRQLKSWIKGSSPAMARVLVMKQGQYIVQETPKDLDAVLDAAMEKVK